jgi:hypothetical protein
MIKSIQFTPRTAAAIRKADALPTVLPGGKMRKGDVFSANPIRMSAIDFYRSLGIELTVGETFEVSYSLSVNGWDDNRTEVFSSTAFSAGAFTVYFSPSTGEFYDSFSTGRIRFMSGEVSAGGALVSVDIPTVLHKPVASLGMLYGILSQRAANWNEGYNAISFLSQHKYGWGQVGATLPLGMSNGSTVVDGICRYLVNGDLGNNGIYTLKAATLTLPASGSFSIHANRTGITFTPSFTADGFNFIIASGSVRSDGTLKEIYGYNPDCLRFAQAAFGQSGMYGVVST